MSLDATFTGTITLDATVGVPPDATRRPAPTTFSFVDEDFQRVTIPFAPEECSVSNLAARWEQVDRPGNRPLLEWAGAPLRTVDIEFTVVYPDRRRIEADLAALVNLGSTGSATGRVSIVGWHSLGRGWWRVTSLSIDTTRLDEENRATEAVVRMTLTELSDVDTKFTLQSLDPTALLRTPGPLDKAVAFIGQGVTAGQQAVAQARAEQVGDAIGKKAWQDIADFFGVEDPRTGKTKPTTPTKPKTAPKPTATNGDWRFVMWRLNETGEDFALRVTGKRTNWAAIKAMNGIVEDVAAIGRPIRVTRVMLGDYNGP